MRSIASALLGLAACNQVFGSREVEQAPAQVFDAPLDAPFGCPAVGTTPQFSPLVHQFQFVDCSYYAVAAGHAIAECTTGVSDHAVFEAEPGGDFLVATGTPTGPQSLSPRISSDGRILLVRHPMQATIDEYHRQGDGWVGFAANVLPAGSVYSSLAQGRVLASISTNLVEYHQVGTQWMELATTPWTDLGITNGVDGMALSFDGLRLVIATPLTTLYTDRSDLDSAFRKADSISVASAADVFLADDCARIYLSGLGSIFYAQQR